MPISYESAVSHLLALGHELSSKRKFDLEHMRILARALGNPQQRLPNVLIAGTNGKGSTAATLAGIVEAAGYRTGLYTSPHLIEINERIQVNGETISNIEFAEMYERVQRAAEQLVAQGELPWHPSFFEMITAMMFEYFASVGVELAVLEVGMGGRLDATNIAEPCVSVITDVDFDHQAFLGNTLREIAGEKAGILRPGGVAVLLPQHPEVNDALGHAILERQARPISAVKHMPPTTPLADRNGGSHHGYPVEFKGKEIVVESPLMGRHQFRNVALALTAAEQLNSFGFAISAEHAEKGVRNTRWPARFQVLPASPDFPETVLDVAHNPAGAWALRSALSTFYEDRPVTLIFGAMRDKAIREIAEILFPLAGRVIVTRAQSMRAASSEDVAAATQHTGADLIHAEDVPAALEFARNVGDKGIIVVTGSIYIVGEALKVLTRSPACVPDVRTQ